MTATANFGLRAVNSEAASPFVPTAKDPSVQGLANWCRSLLGGARSPVTFQSFYDAAAASGAFAIDTSGGGNSGTKTLVINGVNASATWTTSDNNTASLLAAAVNAVSNNLISKLVTASRTQTSATGTLTIESGTGAVGGVIDGTTVTVTWATSDDATAYALADAINADATANTKVTAARTAAGVVTLTAIAGNTYGGVAGNALTLVASGTGVTASAATLAGGVTDVTITAQNPGFGGNAITISTASTGLTASGARLTGGTETRESFTF